MISRKIRLIIFLFLMVILIFNINFCFADDKTISDYINDSINSLDLTELEDYINNLNLDNNGIFSLDFKELILDVINGEFSGDINAFFQIIMDSFSNELLSIIPSMISIIIICIIFSVLDGLTSEFLNKEIRDVTYFVCYAAIILIVLYFVYDVLNSTISTIKLMGTFMEICFPILLTMISLLGGVMSVSAYKPLMSILSVTITKVVINIVIPIAIASIILNVVSNFSKTIKLEKLTSFFKSLANTILGGIFSLFVTFLSFQGLTSGVIDTVTIKNAKFTVENYIPILGGYLSDGYDLILASIVLIKNSFGFLSIIIIISIILVPIVKILILSLSLRLVSAVIEPITDSRISNFVFAVSKNILLFISIVIGVFVMFLIMIMLIIYSCNLGAV